VVQLTFFILFPIAEIALISDAFDYAKFVLFYRIAITTIFSIYLAQSSFMAVKELTKGKTRTIWRIPVIGICAGGYFELKYISLICAAYLALCFVVLWSNRVRYRYLVSKLIFLIPAGVGIFYVDMNFLWFLNIILVWLIIFGSPVLTMANINSMEFSEE